jgi:hypothetical protein
MNAVDVKAVVRLRPATSFTWNGFLGPLNE